MAQKKKLTMAKSLKYRVIKILMPIHFELAPKRTTYANLHSAKDSIFYHIFLCRGHETNTRETNTLGKIK